MSEPALISMNDACELTSLSRTAILRLVDAERFPPKVDMGTGRRFAFNRSDVKEWIEKRLATAKPTNWRMAA